MCFVQFTIFKTLIIKLQHRHQLRYLSFAVPRIKFSRFYVVMFSLLYEFKWKTNESNGHDRTRNQAPNDRQSFVKFDYIYEDLPKQYLLIAVPFFPTAGVCIGRQYLRQASPAPAVDAPTQPLIIFYGGPLTSPFDLD